jgi:alkyldihydroxyacetonephosphate synthase
VGIPAVARQRCRAEPRPAGHGVGRHLGIITECWLRLQARPRFRASAGVVFADWAAGAEATRQIVQAKLWPANLRLLDPAEAAQSAGLDGTQALLIIGFESGARAPGRLHPRSGRHRPGGRRPHRRRAIRIDDGSGRATGREGAVGAWRDSFIGVNAGLTNGLGLLTDTFETAVTWDRWPAFDAAVRSRVGRVLNDVLGDGYHLSCRFTHVYPDGPAPYYTFAGPVDDGARQSEWQVIKDEAMAAVVDAGGTVTHHHAVGRMHKPGWRRQRPDLFEECCARPSRASTPTASSIPAC